MQASFCSRLLPVFVILVGVVGDQQDIVARDVAALDFHFHRVFIVFPCPSEVCRGILFGDGSRPFFVVLPIYTPRNRWVSLSLVTPSAIHFVSPSGVLMSGQMLFSERAWSSCSNITFFFPICCNCLMFYILVSRKLLQK